MAAASGVSMTYLHARGEQWCVDMRAPFSLGTLVLGVECVQQLPFAHLVVGHDGVGVNKHHAPLRVQE